MHTASLPNNLTAALQGLFPAGSEEHVFLVGGTVRDALLGKPHQDIDLLAAVPEQTLQRCGFRRVTGKSTAPIWFRNDPRLGVIEVTHLSDPVKVEQELASRDFTINALAFSLAGHLHDPLNGCSDLAELRLAACSNNCFRDDPLRIFRALRFEAEGWWLTPETESLLLDHDWDNLLNGIPVERFSRELVKGLAAAYPARFFTRMLQLNIGRHWLPELFAMPAVPAGPPEHHPEGDLYCHSLQVLQRAAQLTADPLTRFCAMFHDLGKLQTDPAAYPHHHGHDRAGVEPAAKLCNRLRLPARYRTALSTVNRLHTTINRWEKLRDATRLRLAEQARKARIEEILPLVSQADKPDGAPLVGWELTLQTSRLPIRDLGLHEEELATMTPEARSCLILDRRIAVLRAAAN